MEVKMSMLEAKRSLLFSYDELSAIVVKFKSMLDKDLVDLYEPSKDEVLKIFDEILPKLEAKDANERDIARITWKYENEIRKLEIENKILKEEMDVKDTNLSNLYTQPHVLEFFESRIERLQKSLSKGLQNWQEEKERADKLGCMLEETRGELSEKESATKILEEELNALKKAFGSLALKSGTPKRGRIPRHIETLQRSRSVSPEKSFFMSPKSEKSFPSPSLTQRLAMSYERAATAQLTPISKNLQSKPVTQLSECESSELLGVKSARSFDTL